MLIKYQRFVILIIFAFLFFDAFLEASYSLEVLGNFTKEQSETVCRQLSGHGYPVYIVYGENYEVRVGPYETREKAGEVLDILEQEEKINTKIFEEEDYAEHKPALEEDAQEKEAAGKELKASDTGQYKDERAKKIVSLGLDLFGHPYKYGGENLTNGIDCSFFVQTIFKELGIKLPRTAREQFRQGIKLKKKDPLKVGELVFFKKTYYSKKKNKKGKRTSWTKINHVGIYIGNGEFIHATINVKRVTISRLDEPYFQKRYAGARRFLK